MSTKHLIKIEQEKTLVPKQLGHELIQNQNQDSQITKN